jgi:hypothetical protein
VWHRREAALPPQGEYTGPLRGSATQRHQKLAVSYYQPQARTAISALQQSHCTFVAPVRGRSTASRSASTPEMRSPTGTAGPAGPAADPGRRPAGSTGRGSPRPRRPSAARPGTGSPCSAPAWLLPEPPPRNPAQCFSTALSQKAYRTAALRRLNGLRARAPRPATAEPLRGRPPPTADD